MSASLFGTDGIRGEVNEPPLVPGTMLRVARALASTWREAEGDAAVVLGHDGRRSADYLLDTLAAGLMAKGTSVEDVGLCTTPALAHRTRHGGFAGGVMISASHNPFYDNGIKPFQASGEKLTEAQQSRLEEELEDLSRGLAQRERIGVRDTSPDGLEPYCRALLEQEVRFDGHVVLDCANGGASRIAPRVMEPTCRELTVLNRHPSGVNINDGVGCLHMEDLREAVLERGADLGFAFDGDGDRVLAVSSEGQVVDGDVIMYMLARHRRSSGSGSDAGIVITVMSNVGLRTALNREGIPFDVVGVGDRRVYRGMCESGWRLGGEQSGHLIDRAWLPTGDGLHTALGVLEVLEASGRPLESWVEEVPIQPQVLHNVEVPEQPALESLERTRDRIARTEDRLGDQGRVFVRYSGTEPLARIMLEGPDPEMLKREALEIGETLQDEIAARRRDP